MSSAALTTWLREFSAAEPLLPRTLAAVAVIVTVRAPDGRAIFRSPETDVSLAPLATLDLRGTPAITGLEGFTVEIAHRSRGSVQSRHRRAAAIADSIPARAGAAVGCAGRRGCVADPPRAAPCRRASRLRDARIARVAHAGRTHPHVHRDAVARSCPVRRRASRNAAGAGSRRTSLVDPDRQRAAAGELARRALRTSNRPMLQS